MATNAVGFERALTVRPFRFPADHGPHPSFRTEWWYITGNLMAQSPNTQTQKARDEARRFGFQLTFFRFALAPPASSTPLSDEQSWQSNEVYMAHAALTDVSRGEFVSAERLQRPVLDLAGAQSSPFRVWLLDWYMRTPANSDAEQNANSIFPLQLKAAFEEVEIDLWLRQGKPLILQGDGGLSAKSHEPGNASYYFSFTRLPVDGEVSVDGERMAVVGEAWFDREWSTSALAPSQTGWDWFALQLDDGRELMFYRLREQRAGVRGVVSSASSAGVWVSREGRSRKISADQMRIVALREWTSASTGSRYPVAWRLEHAGAELIVEAVLDDQEHRGQVNYWEGAVVVRGRDARGGALSGRGYVEMTEYTQ